MTSKTLLLFFAISFLHSLHSLHSLQAQVVAQDKSESRPAAAGERSAESGRIRIVETATGKTLRTPAGEPLRGTSLMLFQYARDTGALRFLRRRDYWEQLQSVDINAMRVVFFDAWQRSHGAAGSHSPWPYAELGKKTHVAALLKDLDFMVDSCERNGMQLIINYHDTGGYRDPDYSQPAGDDGHFEYLGTMNYCKQFWELVAPRYADRAHVIFELTNEPAKWTSDAYTESVLADQLILFKLVRRLAPDSHIVTLTFANHQPDDNDHSMLAVTRRLRDNGVDFSNASVSFHPYNRMHPGNNPEQPILDLMQEFPVLNTEQNFPEGVIEGSSDPDASGLEGDRLGVQSMERLGIGWFMWNVDSTADFRKYFIGDVVPDATAKGYFWGK